MSLRLCVVKHTLLALTVCHIFGQTQEAVQAFVVNRRGSLLSIHL